MFSLNKKLFLLTVVTLIGVLIFVMYPRGVVLFEKIRSHSYVYGYSFPGDLEIKTQTNFGPAQGVPIIMYHGVVVNGPIGENTSRRNFIAQMEMLKKEGYTTISVKEYDLFRQGKFVLPMKPIIITFDDGRKDSFYTVDAVLEKLNFKATIFIATEKANNNDPFYLSWDELADVHATGRWEIEAHGRRSHAHIPMDAQKTPGRYLASRMYLEDGKLESIESYKKRVENDYIDGIADITEKLGIASYYFAIPLNSYGTYDGSNYTDSLEYNKILTQRFYRLAFVQAMQKDGVPTESFYNFKDSEPYTLKRFEVKNINAEKLSQALNYKF